MEINKKDMNVLLKAQQGELGCRSHVQRSGQSWILYPAIAHGEYAAVKTYVPIAEKFPEGMFRFEKRIIK